MSAEFRILGPVEADLGGGTLARVPRGRARELLCLLLIHRGQAVSVAGIVDALWDESPPANARNAVQVVVSRLRAAVGSEAVSEGAGGYSIVAGPVDADQFERLLTRGYRELDEQQPVEARSTLSAALALWRGPVLADVRGRDFAQPEIARLEALHLRCRSERIAADMAAGGEVDTAAELAALVLEHPLDERLRELQMLALYRSGRQTDALAAYRDARRALLDGLGLEPSVALRQLEAAILRHDVPPLAATPVTRPASDPDRRRATCLFARVEQAHDAAGVDPEALRTDLGELQRQVEVICARHGGSVIERRADGVLAVFGVPTAHEDDALRAVRAAVDLRDAPSYLGRRFAVGISSGLVVGTGGTGVSSLVGQPVIAAEALAHGTGEVALTGETWALVEHAVRGELQPDGCYRVETVIEGAPAIPRSLDRPLVGRGHEVDALIDGHRTARAESRWVLATVIGEAGIGKSRLAAELESALPTGTLVLRGDCPTYSAGATFRPLRDVVLGAASGREIDQLPAALGVDPEVVERVAAAVGLRQGSVGEEAAWAFGRFLGALGGDQPVTVVLDDVHWAEPGLLDLLLDLPRRAGPKPGLLVCLARPELLEARPAWSRGHDHAVQIELGPLTPPQSEQLLDELGAASIGGDARRRIAGTAAGNPLFLEQLAAYVGERPDASVLPPAIHSLLAARLDLLEPAERAVLCYGSICGDEFDALTVHALADGAPLAELESACATLVRRNLTLGDATYRFRHALIREAAYASLSKTARARLHERYAVLLAGSEGDAARVGYQLESAARCAQEIGAANAVALAGRAREALASAAGDAHRRGDLGGEIGLLERAIRLEAETVADRADLLPVLAAALFDAGSFGRATDVAEEGIRTGSQLGLPRVRARALVERERLRVYLEQATIEVSTSQAVLDEALSTLRDLDDDLGLARAHYLRSELLWMGGDPEAGSASAERMLHRAGRAGSGFEASAAVGFMAWSLVQGMTPVEPALVRCRELERRLAGDRIAALETAGYRAVLTAMAGDFEAARAAMGQSRAGLDDIGLRRSSASMALFDAQLELLAGDAAAAERAVRDAERITSETGDRWFQSTVLVDLACVLLRRDSATAAQAVCDIDRIPAPADAEWVIKRLCARALAAAAAGDAEGAVSEARAATAVADRTTMLTFRADAHSVLAEVLACGGNSAAAEIAFDQALSLYRDKGNMASAAALVQVAGM